MISHKIYICSGWTYCYPILPTTVGIGAARKLIPCAGKEICRVCRISIQLMTSMSFGYKAFYGEEIKRGIKSGNITPDASTIRFSDKVLDEQKHAIKISDEKVALAVPAYELAMEHFIDLVFTSVVDAQVQQLDQYLKKFDEELQRERESAATTGSAAQNLENNVKATSGRGRLQETAGLLIMGGPEIDTGKDVNRLTNKAVLVQVLESQWAPVPVRCMIVQSELCHSFQRMLKAEALRCIGDLIASHTKNLDALASKVLEEEPQVEPALNSILRIILWTSSMQEFVAADYVFKCFCKKNPDGQAMLASTSIPQPQPTTHALPEDVRTCHLEAEPRKRLTRSTVASIAEIEDVEENKASDLKNKDHPMLASMFDAKFVDFIRNLEADIKESIVDVYNNAKDLAKIGRGGSSQPEHRSSGGSERVQLETLHIDLQEASQRLDTLKTEKTKIESEASMYCNLAGKMKSYLKSLSDAYNSLEQANFHLEKEIKALKSGGPTHIPDAKAVKAKAREEAQKESEAELNDLLVCLGQEQS
ncbi:unnamed protein product [Camellia sinensis]